MRIAASATSRVANAFARDRAPRRARPGMRALDDVVGDLEDRQVHRDEQAADDAAEERPSSAARSARSARRRRRRPLPRRSRRSCRASRPSRRSARRRRSSARPWAGTRFDLRQRLGHRLAFGDRRARHQDRLARRRCCRRCARTISSASRIGTPDESSVPSVRVKRATATLRSSDAEDRQLQEDARRRSRGPCSVP